jgi:hypothetical protein
MPDMYHAARGTGPGVQPLPLDAHAYVVNRPCLTGGMRRQMCECGGAAAGGPQP